MTSDCSALGKALVWRRCAMRRAVKILNAKKLKPDKSVIFNRSANQTANRRPYIDRLREFCGWIDIIKGQNVSDVDSPTDYT